MEITKEDREALERWKNHLARHPADSSPAFFDVALRAVADSDAAHAGLQALETEFNRVVSERNELKKDRDHIFHPANWPGEDGVYHRPAARDVAQKAEPIDLAARLEELRSVNDGSAITVWKNGTWQRWQTLDAKYAEKDPDWLCTIPLAEEVPQKAAEDVETVIAWLETHYKYLANPLTGNERALVGDLLKALSARTPEKPSFSAWEADFGAREERRAKERSGGQVEDREVDARETVVGPNRYQYAAPGTMSLERCINFLSAHNDGIYRITASKELDNLVASLLKHIADLKGERQVNPQHPSGITLRDTIGRVVAEYAVEWSDEAEAVETLMPAIPPYLKTAKPVSEKPKDGFPDQVWLYQPFPANPELLSLCWTRDTRKGQVCYLRQDDITTKEGETE